jgi:hypothetical protein
LSVAGASSDAAPAPPLLVPSAHTPSTAPPLSDGDAAGATSPTAAVLATRSVAVVSVDVFNPPSSLSCAGPSPPPLSHAALLPLSGDGGGWPGAGAADGLGGRRLGCAPGMAVT